MSILKRIRRLWQSDEDRLRQRFANLGWTVLKIWPSEMGYVVAYQVGVPGQIILSVFNNSFKDLVTVAMSSDFYQKHIEPRSHDPILPAHQEAMEFLWKSDLCVRQGYTVDAQSCLGIAGGIGYRELFIWKGPSWRRIRVYRDFGNNYTLVWVSFR